jgi:oxygen-dependent protoporphyrinogen oxidase
VARVAVVGGGITGLSAALELRDLGHSVTLIEAEPRLGGKLYTEHDDGLLIDAGPDSFLSSKPAALALIERLGLSSRVINTLADGGGTFILRGGRLHPLPEGITLLVPAEFRNIARTSLLTPRGKLRMALDYVIPARKQASDESIGAFVERRVGRQAFERLAEPLLSGIYAGDARKLSLLATFPRLRDIERTHGGMIRGAIAQRRQARQSATAARKHTPFVSLSGGMRELVDALGCALAGCDARTATCVTNLERIEDIYRLQLAGGAYLDVDGVILAVPAFAASALLHEVAPPLATELSEIEYVSTATISMAFRAADIAGRALGRGFVIPRAEGRTLTAVTWTFSKFAGRAPSGTALMRGFVGRAGDEMPTFWPDDQLLTVVRREFTEILGITAEPVFTRVYRWPRAMPQYNLGHPERLIRIEQALDQLPGLALAGSPYRGVGIPDCIQDGINQARAMHTRIQVSRPTRY